MKINVETTIARPIEDIWSLVADDFTSIQRWSESVITSDVLADTAAVDGAPVAGRYCTFTDDPEGFAAREAITRYDRANFVLEFDVEPVNAPRGLPLIRNHVTITLEALSPSQTKLRWEAEPVLKLHGVLLYPLLKAGMAKSFRGIIEELEAYAEAEGERSSVRPHMAAAV